jgi:hypothetical protein
MKPVRSALLFAISVVSLSACFNPPEFSNSPSIEFKGISFQKAPNGEDSLVVSVTFQDGDGDLGFHPGQDNLLPPYNQINFYANDNGELFPLPSILIPGFQGYSYKKTKKTPRDFSYYIEEPPKTTGELITLNSRNEGFSLPPLTRPYDCFINKESYLNEDLAPDTIYIWREDDFLIKDQSKIVDTLVNNSNANEWYFVVVDYFYIRENPRHYNFIVEFWVEENGTFVEYDFREQFCETYDGRFPVLTDKERALEGEINYSMVGTGFLATFSIKTLKLKISVYDRAGNQSNVVETPPFRLEEI